VNDKEGRFVVESGIVLCGGSNEIDLHKMQCFLAIVASVISQGVFVCIFCSRWVVSPDSFPEIISTLSSRHWTFGDDVVLT